MVTKKQQEKIDSLMEEVNDGGFKVVGVKEEGKAVFVKLACDTLSGPLKFIVVGIGLRGGTKYNYIMEGNDYVF